MALSVKSGSFTADTTVTSPFKQSVTGLGFQPKAMIFFSQGLLTSDGTTSSTKAGFAIGISDGTNSVVAGWGGNGGVGTTAVDRTLASTVVGSGGVGNAVIWTPTGGTASDVLGSLVSFDTDGFTIQWGDNTTLKAPTSAWVIHYIAFGGADLANAAVGSQAAPVAAGSSSVTGLSFQPNFVMLLTGQTLADQLNSPPGVMSFGCAISSSARFAHALGVSNGQTMSANVNGLSIQRNDACLLCIQPSTSTVTDVADFTSFNSDGFTINFSAVGNTNKYWYLALGGSNLNWDINTAARPTTASAQSRTGLSFKPQLTWWSNSDLTTLNSLTSNAALAVGHSDGTTSKSLYATHNDAINTVCGTNAGSNACQDGAPANSSGSASFTSFNSDGWTITWGATGAANQISSVSVAGTTVTAGVAEDDTYNINPLEPNEFTVNVWQ